MGSDRVRENLTLSFREWVNHETKMKRKRGRKNVRSDGQAGGEIWNQIFQGEDPRALSEVKYQRILYFPEP